MSQRVTDFRKRQEALKEQAYKEMKRDYLKGIPVRLIANQYNITRQTFYKNVDLSEEDHEKHANQDFLVNAYQKET